MSGRRLAALGLATFGLACGNGETGEVVRVTIPPGAGLAPVAESLAAHGLLENRSWFRLLGRLRRVDRRLQAGVYDLPRGASPWRLLTIIASGKVATVSFTVPEGLALPELAELAEERLGIPTEAFRAAAGDPALLRKYGISAPGAEGYLLPETYQLPLPVTAMGLVETMLQQFQRAWKPSWDRRLDSLGWTRTEALTLASIVEGEARYDDERATIAGVYLNRLRRGMPLQADPTVQYALLLATGRRKPRLFFKDYAFRSPYNTYLYPGLPPGPVNSPGLRSIEAALYPAATPYLYFVAGPDGRHIFSRTLTEHLGALRRLRGSGGGEGARVRRREGGGREGRASRAPPQGNSLAYSRAAASTSSRPRIPEITATPTPPAASTGFTSPGRTRPIARQGRPAASPSRRRNPSIPMAGPASDLVPEPLSGPIPQ